MQVNNTMVQLMTELQQAQADIQQFRTALKRIVDIWYEEFGEGKLADAVRHARELLVPHKENQNVSTSTEYKSREV